jgi:hypothetical protein
MLTRFRWPPETPTSNYTLGCSQADSLTSDEVVANLGIELLAEAKESKEQIAADVLVLLSGHVVEPSGAGWGPSMGRERQGLAHGQVGEVDVVLWQVGQLALKLLRIQTIVLDGTSCTDEAVGIAGQSLQER